MECAVLGGGSWGTALASQLARNGHAVWLWDRHPERCASINRDHQNPRYLKGERLPENLRATPDLIQAVSGADLVVPVLPSHALREVLGAARDAIRPAAVICTATKGLEDDTLLTMDEVQKEVLPALLGERATLLYGPSFAIDVVRGLPTAVAIAGPQGAAHVAAGAFHGGAFRAYHTDDVVGVCLGGSLKNVMAIACGVSDGLKLGANARAAIITRGLAEITRLAVARGAEPLTMMGLAGMGDLVLTCTGDSSRNRRVGLALGAGKKLPEILDELGEVAEGVHTAKNAVALARKTGVEMPITEQVYRMLFEGLDVRVAIANLLSRERRAERDDDEGPQG